MMIRRERYLKEIRKVLGKQVIQVTYLLAEESTIEREFSVLEAINDNYPKMVISMDRINHSSAVPRTVS